MSTNTYFLVRLLPGVRNSVELTRNTKEVFRSTFSDGLLPELKKSRRLAVPMFLLTYLQKRDIVRREQPQERSVSVFRQILTKVSKMKQ